jgi:WD40 repeat protein
MTEAFDPYRKWLGIPPEEQPPHHYRLLGIGLFEDDPDVIEAAADRQMAHVQTYKTGKHSALSQRILNELAAAKLCLLDKSKKSGYDEHLRNKLLTTRLPPAPPPVSLAMQTGPALSVASQETSPPAFFIVDSPAAAGQVSAASASHYVRHHKRARRMQWIVLAVAIAAVAGGGIWMWRAGFAKPTTTDTNHDEPFHTDFPQPGSGDTAATAGNPPNKWFGEDSSQTNPGGSTNQSGSANTGSNGNSSTRPTPIPSPSTRPDSSRLARLVRTLEGHQGAVSGIALSPDARSLLSAGLDQKLRLWRLANKTEAIELAGHTGPVRCVAVSADGRQALSAGDDGTLRLWDLEQAKQIKLIKTSLKRVNSVALTPGGLKAWVAGDMTAALFDLENGVEVLRQDGFEADVLEVAVSESTNRVAAAAADGTVRVWSYPRDERETIEFKHPMKLASSSLAFSPEGQKLAVGSHDRSVHLFDLDARREIGSLSGHASPVLCVAFSEDGTLVASGSGSAEASEGTTPKNKDDTVRVWDVRTRRELQQCQGHTAGVTGVVFGPSGHTVLSGSGDGTIRIWRLKSERREASADSQQDEPDEQG